MNKELQVALFPLTQTVIYPDTSIPLYIFEPRYLKMVHDSLTLHQPIAITPFREDGNYESIICGFGYPHILKQRDDGTLDIVLICNGKGKLLEKSHEKPYLTYGLEYRPEREGQLSEELTFALARIEMKCRQWIDSKNYLSKQRDEMIKLLQNPAVMVHYGALLLLSDSDIKQKILNLDYLGDKIQLLDYSLFASEMININNKL